MLEPTMAILDETDSGLDIDALRIVSEGVNALRGPSMGVLIITHYQRILNYITPDIVHVMYRGQIIKTGGAELALRTGAEGLRVAHRRARRGCLTVWRGAAAQLAAGPRALAAREREV